ncbi:RNA pyrophosphohydrolase [Bartonella henselae]|uniref:RNA pyrophosphohydrolase n=1 Tax=Bartonella henselae (strain ATCC 49882 / DSM 28221 / CCUG 30454 / Houston 1) TaxID=283166 RepID=RPPH_BARHE|nr:RNA pyrophosphohydrolase [Bartonella henselae]Q6G4Y4.1 RecName: Full=RNA pyrophosphohydrolase; AltName: Full=(Di)nucleoside polyphosphate hydrolase [Bartonella henselae str. Houston-1]ATP11807.1 RNA pyrophosphohydrolase [Bartonella henselae]ETS10273.1 RNA pyrophosphohydrolase [Bartonella henselae JK 50]ETS10780.1 RNA pyrophosphohydrolase [Bartonella henselae JK 51]MDM9991014.1 RNA pyrophosphohydrolase [Bartonella henselae]OLL42058.1 RNA pyrophosphohydrolase [Bartonella henselae]
MDAVVNLTTLPYRRSVGILVFNHEGKVWVGRRLMVCIHEDTKIYHRWQLPQGGIDENEEPLDAARRELYEETGIRSIELIKEAKYWFHYDFPQEIVGSVLGSKYRGQIQKWFAFQFTGELSEIKINPPPDGHKAEFDQWKWVDLETLPSIVISFKKHVYMKIVNEFRGSFKGL